MSFYMFSMLLGWLLLGSNSILADELFQNEHYVEDAAIVKKCLTDKSGNIAKSDLEKVAHFGNWSQGEEILCFSHCLSNHKGWFDVSARRWIRDKIEADLGENMYKYCENELERSFESVCDFVHKGFRCLRDAANNIAETYKTMLICANELHVTDVAELQKYGTFPSEEHIPCLFKCFAEKFSFYDQNLEWNLNNWIKAFGQFKTQASSDNFQICRASEEERSQEDKKCAWMYKEYLCLEQFSEEETAVDTTTIPTTTTTPSTTTGTTPETTATIITPTTTAATTTTTLASTEEQLPSEVTNSEQDTPKNVTRQTENEKEN